MTEHNVTKTSELSGKNSTFLIQGFFGDAAGLKTSSVEFAMPQERWLTGGTLIVNGGHWGDKCSIEIVDKDNLLGYGVDTVLRTFVKDFVVSPDNNIQLNIDVTYVSLVPAGIYIRLKYTNTDSNTCSVGCNLFTHIPKS